MIPPSPSKRLALLMRTVRHLQPAQILHRIRLRVQKALYQSAPDLSFRIHSGTARRPPGWPLDFVPVDGREAAGYPDPMENARGTFEFVGQRRTLGSSLRWNPAEASQLWRYHLHYMEWAWSFAALADSPWASRAFGDLWRSWREGTTFGRWDAWSPYVVSVRAWTLCGIYRDLVAGGPDEADFLDDLLRHGRFIRANLERDVGGNHLLKNLKGLLGVGVFLANDAWVRLALAELRRQLSIQVLADGGHYERSPSYHGQVLGDLIDVADLLRASGRTVPDELDDAISRMRVWLGEMLAPDGDVPLFNDCTLVGSERLNLLRPTPSSEGMLTVLADSGYIVMRPSPRVHLVLDVGLPCPEELPAHAHADCLSFELSVDGRRVIVDTGTSTYSTGPIRDHERSTRAHNTVEIGGFDQTEVWGAFRAARRATPHLEVAEQHGDTIEVLASHDGYGRLPGRPRHRRRWRTTPEGLTIVDEVSSTRRYAITSRLHLAPGIGVTAPKDDRFSFRAGGLDIVFTHGDVELTEAAGAEADPMAWRAESFGRREPVAVLAHQDTGTRVSLGVHIGW